jgi:hypothetical protein
VVVLAVFALVFASGLGPALAGGNGEDVGTFPTASAGSGGGGSGGGSGSTSAYTLVVDDVEPCGQTCRDVTSTLTNEQSTDATDVTVYTRIYAGNGTDGDVVWEGKEPVGDLDAGESYTATRRIELSLWDANKVREHDGWVTIKTAVRSDERTDTFSQRRDVA